MVILGACSFDPEMIAAGTDASVSSDGRFYRVDAKPEPEFHALHLLPEDALPGMGALDLVGGVLDTSAPSLDVDLPAGVTLDVRPQTGDGPSVAVLAVASLHISGTLVVTGSRPLIILARDDVVVAGTIAAAASGSQPGPGGASSMPGGPTAGIRGLSLADGGGGGGGHGTEGASGGSSDAGTGGVGGAAIGDAMISVLVGGGAGGHGSPGGCSSEAEGGGGGGAIQITAGIAIQVDGTVSAGGGGGGSGALCASNGGGGAGGGAGGAIVLEAASVRVAGMVAANGGGGGGGSDASPALLEGVPGSNALDGATAAPGGTMVGDAGMDGGAGGYRDGLPSAGTGIADGNAGGGGGAVGRIAIYRHDTEGLSGTITPAPVLAMP